MLLAGTDEPDYHIDIESFMDIKISALLAHVSQMGGRDAEGLKRMYQERIQASAADEATASLPKLRESFKKVILRR
jgi:LmbE family N-acetylglucosaminyl deacetylase